MFIANIVVIHIVDNVIKCGGRLGVGGSQRGFFVVAQTLFHEVGPAAILVGGPIQF
jgi:hypothetical protein